MVCYQNKIQKMGLETESKRQLAVEPKISNGSFLFDNRSVSQIKARFE